VSLIARRDVYRTGLKAALIMLGLCFVGCSHRETADQALDRAMKEANQTRGEVAKFAGKVTIDGQPPSLPRGKSLVVMLYNPQKPPANRQVLPYSARCRPDGSFAFNTYGTDDGAPVGKYIVLFAELQPAKVGFVGPDGLKNLYNDPERNDKDPQFQLNLTEPGRSDWTCDLAVAGKEANENPGPHAATGIVKKS
jgi:hypothetical protein